MPTHLLLEGGDIESVLAQLRESHGPDAKIIQAELVRTGGFAGFFAKRRYEVTVEVDDHLDPATKAAPASALPLYDAETRVDAGSRIAAASGIDALLSAAEDGDQTFIGVPASLVGNDQLATVSAASAAASSPLSLLASDAHPGATHGWHRPVSTEGPAFSDVLDSLTQSLAVQPHDPEPAFEAFTASGTPHPPTDLAELLEMAEAVSPVRPFVPPEPSVAALPTAVSPVAELGPTRDQLAGLGIPARLLTDLTSAEPLLALWDVVGALPEPKQPRLRPSATRGGALVVVVGSWTTARSAVDALLAEIGATPDAVFAVGTSGDDLPAGRTVRSHAAAVDLVRASRQAHDSTVLLLDPGHGMHSAARVAQLVATVEPQFVLVAADAGSELGASLTALDALDDAGVEVDAIALDGAARAERPAAVFEVPIAVSWIDGRPATPGAWIGLLMDTLSTRTPATRRGHRC